MEQIEANVKFLEKQPKHPKTVLKFKHGPTFLAVLSACLSGLSGGAMLGYSSPAIPSINSEENTFHLTEDEIALVVSLASLGGFFGGIIGGISLDKSGRKFTIMFNILPQVVGWLLIISSYNVYPLYVGRFLSGYSAGAMDASVTVYVSEVSAAEVRGLMSLISPLFYTIGYLYVYILGTWLSWRWLAVGCEIVPVVMIICMFYVPESPHYLLKTGQREQCINTLHWLRGKSANIDAEFNEINETVKRTKQNSVSYSEFLKPNVYRPLGVIWILLIFQEMVGSNVLTQYMSAILTSAGAELSANAETAIVGAGGVLSCALAAVLVDKIGRRIVLFISSIIIALSLIGLSIYFTILNHSPTTFNINPLLLLSCLVLYQISTQFGIATVPFVLAGELLPLNVRGKASGWTLSFAWATLFVYSLLFQYSVSYINYDGTFWIMAASAVFATFYIYFMVPEKKGMTLEEIEQSYLN